MQDLVGSFNHINSSPLIPNENARFGVIIWRNGDPEKGSLKESKFGFFPLNGGGYLSLETLNKLKLVYQVVELTCDFLSLQHTDSIHTYYKTGPRGRASLLIDHNLATAFFF